MVFVQFSNIFHGLSTIFNIIKLTGKISVVFLLIFMNLYAIRDGSVIVSISMLKVMLSIRLKPLDVRKGLTVSHNFLFCVIRYEVILEK